LYLEFFGLFGGGERRWASWWYYHL
jgi:hypothetical protein